MHNQPPPTEARARVLYICYGSITDPLIQSQALAYLQGLAKVGHYIHLLTFEAAPLRDKEYQKWETSLEQQGITWHQLRYHQRPGLPASFYDVLKGVQCGLHLIKRHRITTVHARSHIPAVMGMLLKKAASIKLLFDFRGILAEEREDVGAWKKNSLASKVVRRLERGCIERADAIVVLTQRFASELTTKYPGIPIHIIPCCADVNAIRSQRTERDKIRELLGLQPKTIMVYMGKIGTWYMLAEMVDFFTAARSIIPNLHFLFMTQSDTSPIVNCMENKGVPDSKYSIVNVEHSQIGGHLAAADFAISFIQPYPSKRASSPTKISEYLAAGLPVLSNRGIGDIDSSLNLHRAGVILDHFEHESYQAAARSMSSMMSDDSTRHRCETAAAGADLMDVGISRYDKIYMTLA